MCDLDPFKDSLFVEESWEIYKVMLNQLPHGREVKLQS